MLGPIARHSGGEDKFSTRFIFYNGISTNSSGTSYPQASYRSTGFSLKLEDSIIFIGEKGVVKTRWKEYLRFLINRKTVKYDLNYHFKDLVNIDFESKYRIDGINYLIKSIDATLTMRGISPAKATLYTV